MKETIIIIMWKGMIDSLHVVEGHNAQTLGPGAFIVEYDENDDSSEVKIGDRKVSLDFASAEPMPKIGRIGLDDVIVSLTRENSTKEQEDAD